MTISEMHVWFRQYAQQMGMQNVRAILPEQIDNLINTAIKDTIDEVINKSVGTTNDRVITDNAKLANINALRTLYRVKTYQPRIPEQVGNEALHFVNSFNNSCLSIKSSDIVTDALYYVDFSIKYQKPVIHGISTNTTYTRLFPIRIIDDSYLADVLNDWVLAPRMRTPVMVIYNDDASSADAKDSKFDIYIGDNSSISSITQVAKIKSIRCSYIKAPKKVAYLSDVGGTNVDCDLPEQLQIPMLKHAVDLYRVSIQGSLYANQQNAQQNQQEIARNNARPDNEGYQS